MAQHNPEQAASMHPLLQSVLPTSDFSVSLPSLGIVQIKGADAAKFLQGQITQDVLTMADYEQRMAACCNAQGRMRAIFRLIKLPDGFFLLLPKEIIPPFIEALKKYAVFFKVQLTDASEQWSVQGLYQVEKTVATNSPTSIRLALDSHRSLHISPSQGEHGESDESRWHALDVVHRTAWVWLSTVESLLPHDVGLKDVGGISFDKGCYTGQEIVARMEYRGKLKSTVAIAFSASTDAVRPGTEVNDGDRAVGQVLGAAKHPIAGQLLLLNLQVSALESAIALNLPSRPILQVLT